VRGDRYLIAEAAAQCSDKRLLAGLRQLRRVILIERNADAPVVAHGRTIATRKATRTVTAADPLPGHLPDALDPHPPTLRYALNRPSALAVRQAGAARLAEVAPQVADEAGNLRCRAAGSIGPLVQVVPPVLAGRSRV